jgi:hypothetical protein
MRLASSLRRTRSRSRDELSRHISLVTPSALHGETPRVLDDSRAVALACGVAALSCAAFVSRLFVWAPVGAAVALCCLTLTPVLVARDAWLLMKKSLTGTFRLEGLRSALGEWRSDFKHGGAQTSSREARKAVTKAAMPICIAFVVAHVQLMTAEALPERFVASCACVAVDLAAFLLMWFCCEITTQMASQQEFLTSARLRLAEASYAWADSISIDEPLSAEQLASLHLSAAITQELRVIEDFTREQSFVVFGFAIEGGRASHFLALEAAFLQHFCWDWQLADPRLSLASCAVGGICCAALLWTAFKPRRDT